VLASGAEETSEAAASSIGIIALSSSRAVTASLSAISIKRVKARRALLEIA